MILVVGETKKGWLWRKGVYYSLLLFWWLGKKERRDRQGRIGVRTRFYFHYFGGWKKKKGSDWGMGIEYSLILTCGREKGRLEFEGTGNGTLFNFDVTEKSIKCI